MFKIILQCTAFSTILKSNDVQKNNCVSLKRHFTLRGSVWKGAFMKKITIFSMPRMDARRKNLHLALLALVLLAAPLSGQAMHASSPTGEELFINGTIHVDTQAIARTLLVIDGRVAGIDVNPAHYPNATIIDLNGAFAYPGFDDSHVHLIESAYFFSAGINLMSCKNADDIASALSGKVKTMPKGKIVLGLGFSLRDYDQWSLEDLAKLDAVTGDHPAFLADKLGHNAIINSAAIKLAGITAETPVPLGGKMGTESGKLTGMLRESAMILPFNTLFSLFDKDEIRASTEKMARQWAMMGYTSIVELMGGPGARFMMPEVFQELEAEGKLPLRVNYAYTIFNLNDVDTAAQYRGRDTDLVRFMGCKIFVDGAFAGGQAWTSWANNQGNHGLQEIYTDDAGGPELNLNRIVAKVEEYGMNMHYHVQGDMAIEAVLDALDKVRAEKGEIKSTHTLIHLAFPTDEQIARIKSFNGKVITTVQPGFWPVENDTEYYYGDWAEKAYPIKKLIDSGISVGISTDFSVSPPAYTPATTIIGIATTGNNAPEIHQPLSILDAVRGLTEGSAATTGRADTGSLHLSNKADLVIFDAELYTTEPKAFTSQTPKIMAVYVSGRKVFSAK